jgi:coniferyl-aldehyde dehydrogenase
MTLTSPPAVNVAPVSVERVQEVLDKQREAFLREGPPTADVRRNRIDRLASAILESAEDLAAAMSADFGNRPIVQSLQTDIAGSIPGTMYVRNHFEEWMADRPVEGSAEKGMATFVQVRPKGVVGIIGTWNFPVHLIVEPAVEALAAGNRLLIKFSKSTPRTGEVFARAVASRFDEDEIFVVYGGQVSGSAFADLHFDHLFFTGSPEVGAAVATAASRNLVPTTLELGGKNPVVVGPDADIAEAAARVAAQRMMNNGQLCLSTDYVWVPRAACEAFVDAAEAALLRYFPTFLDNPDVISEIDDGNYDRVIGLIENAKAKGATVRFAVREQEQGRVPDRASRYIPPTIITGVTEAMDIAGEEVFGPVLTVYAYDDVQEAIDYIKHHPHPLASYWYGDDTPEFREFIRQTNSGGVTRNDMALHFSVEGAPFGGVGKSGWGAYHGKRGFDELSHERTITQSALPFSVGVSTMPPYGEEALTKVRQGISAALGVHLAALGEAPTKS